LAFLVKEGATAVITPSAQGDGGTIFVSQASLPGADTTRTNSTETRPRLSPWSTNAPATPPQIAMATEDYNRLARMIKQGEKLKMTLDLQVLYYDDDLMAYNTIAEIPGGDLKEQVVMLGGHLDSWHSGTGATDNGAGVAAAMEAVRIIEAAKLRPRRTIRVALWTGEEQGLLGSKAYVAQHFGHYTNAAPATSSGGGDAPGNDSDADRKLVREPEYDQFSAYFNLDNGAGKIRGVYMQGDEAVRPLFRKWLRPFADLGAETLTPSNTGSTDHVSFDTIGLPGFQFIQDPLEYMSRSHHSNADVYDRISEDDMKQASTVLAAFVYNAAMLDEKIPRKPAQ
jgi:Zn-dependent M28 family amino/carboxypeptidase